MIWVHKRCNCLPNTRAVTRMLQHQVVAIDEMTDCIKSSPKHVRIKMILVLLAWHSYWAKLEIKKQTKPLTKWLPSLCCRIRNQSESKKANVALLNLEGPNTYLVFDLEKRAWVLMEASWALRADLHSFLMNHKVVVCPRTFISLFIDRCPEQCCTRDIMEPGAENAKVRNKLTKYRISALWSLHCE